MIELFEIIAVTSIWILGLTIVTQPDMALYAIRDALTDNNGKALKKIYEPLIVCHWCMASIHSLIGITFCYLLGFINLEWRLVFMYPLIVMGSSFMVGMLWQLWTLMDKITKYYAHEEQLSYFEVKRQKQNFQNKNNSHGIQKNSFQKRRLNENY